MLEAAAKDVMGYLLFRLIVNNRVPYFYYNYELFNPLKVYLYYYMNYYTKLSLRAVTHKNVLLTKCEVKMAGYRPS